MRPSRLAEGSKGGSGSMRTEAAFVRAIDSSLALDRSVDRVIAALDDITPPGFIRAPLSDEDSLVIAIKDVASPRATTAPPEPDERIRK